MIKRLLLAVPGLTILYVGVVLFAWLVILVLVVPPTHDVAQLCCALWRVSLPMFILGSVLTLAALAHTMITA